MTDVTPRKSLRKLTPAVVWIAIAVVLGLILLFSSFFMVDQKEEAVVLNFGKFSRTLSLPFPVDSGKAMASFENGVLEIRLPKAETAKSKRIEVK